MDVEDYNSNGGGGQPENVELADVRLLNQQRETEVSPFSWHSASGRGFTTNRAQSGEGHGVSHVATALGEAFYAQERCATNACS